MYVLRTIARLQPLREPDSGGGQGGNQGGGQQPPADDRQNLQGLLARHQGDAMAVVATLLSENHSLRDERRTLRGQLPAQGAVVLSPEQAKQWEAYGQLGPLDQLTAALKERETAQAELTGLKREKQIGDAAGVAGYKPGVLSQLPGAADLTFEVRETTADGKPAKAAFVKDKDGKEHGLTDYAKAQWADFLPALQAAPAQQQSAGVSYVRQDAGGGAAPSALERYATRFQEQRDAAANPLAPKPASSPLA